MQLKTVYIYGYFSIGGSSINYIVGGVYRRIRENIREEGRGGGVIRRHKGPLSTR